MRRREFLKLLAQGVPVALAAAEVAPKFFFDCGKGLYTRELLLLTPPTVGVIGGIAMSDYGWFWHGSGQFEAVGYDS